MCQARLFELCWQMDTLWCAQDGSLGLLIVTYWQRVSTSILYFIIFKELSNKKELIDKKKKLKKRSCTQERKNIYKYMPHLIFFLAFIFFIRFFNFIHSIFLFGWDIIAQINRIFEITDNTQHLLVVLQHVWSSQIPSPFFSISSSGEILSVLDSNPPNY